MEAKTGKCIFCGAEIKRACYGNNAQPVADGVCCDDCNYGVVIPLRMSGLKKFYFTYGTHERYPFRGGWTEVWAPSMSAAIDLFRMYHPHPTDPEIVNCCDWYTAESFEKSAMYTGGNFGKRCNDIIVAAQLKVGGKNNDAG